MIPLIPLLLLPHCASAEVTLVSDGKALATVLVPKNPSPSHKLAAEELAYYIEASTGAQLPIVEEDVPVKAVPLYVGNTQIASHRPDLTHLPPDSFEVHIDTDGIVLHGRNPLANLYAVYDFLERELGVRWLTPDPNGTIIPKKTTLVIHETQRVCSPAFQLRMFFIRDSETAKWALRNRLNGLLPAEWADRLDDDLAYLPPGIGSGIHSFADLVPPDKYFAQHPEYFPLIRGERRPISLHSGQLCTTNEDVIRLVADQVKQYFAEHPHARIFPVAPDDGHGWCECEKCRSLDEELGGGRRWEENEAFPVTTDRLMHFLNQVAERALADYPDKLLITLAYINYLPPPYSVEVDLRVLPLICHYAPACYAHQMSDPACEANARFLANLKGWIQKCPNAGVYAYIDKSMWYYFWRPVFRLMTHDIRFLYETGIRNYLAQSTARNWDYMGPLYWVTARMLWDPNQDVDALLEEWCQTLYGPAGHAMLEHYNLLEQAVLVTGKHYRDHPFTQAVGLYDLNLIAQAEAALTKAENIARDDAVVTERLAAVRARWTISSDCYHYLAAYHRYEESGDLADLQLATTKLENLQSYISRGWVPYSCPSAETLQQEISSGGIRWSGFGQEERKGEKGCRNSDETGPGDGAAGWATLQFFVSQPEKGTRLLLTVWGQSAGFSLLICSRGRGAGTNAGGEWKVVGSFTPSGREEWQEVVFEIPPDFYEPGVSRQIVGFGGGDSQIWIAEVRVEPLE